MKKQKERTSLGVGKGPQGQICLNGAPSFPLRNVCLRHEMRRRKSRIALSYSLLIFAGRVLETRGVRHLRSRLAHSRSALVTNVARHRHGVRTLVSLLRRVPDAAGLLTRIGSKLVGLVRVVIVIRRASNATVVVGRVRRIGAHALRLIGCLAVVGARGAESELRVLCEHSCLRLGTLMESATVV